LDFHSISVFRISLEELCHKPKDGYPSCCEDICTFFNSYTDAQIEALNINLYSDADFYIKKVRIKNSDLNLSARDGYRLIFLFDRNLKVCSLLEIYPKQGKYGKSNIDKGEHIKFLQKYIEEKKNNTLILHDINNGLNPI